VTSSVDGAFYHGTENIIAGKLRDEAFSLKVEGASYIGKVPGPDVSI
jgi:hypothetical protein